MLGRSGGVPSARRGCRCLVCRGLIRAELCSRVCFIFNCFGEGRVVVASRCGSLLAAVSALGSALSPSPLAAAHPMGMGGLEDSGCRRQQQRWGWQCWQAALPLSATKYHSCACIPHAPIQCQVHPSALQPYWDLSFSLRRTLHPPPQHVAHFDLPGGFF